MRFADSIKEYVLGTCNMDLVGIAPASALDDEPAGHRATDILPGAKSILVFGRRLADGAVQAAFRALEDGNLDAQSSYATYGCDLTPNMMLFFMQFNIAQYIEQTFGYTAVPVPSGPMQNVTSTNVKRPVFMGPLKTHMLLNLDKAAVAAGLGEYGWSNFVVTPQYGPRQQFGMVVTQMELDYDRPYVGPQLCDPKACGICSRVCPTGAISPCKGRHVTVADQHYQMAEVNANACAVASLAFRQEFAGKVKVPDLITHNNPTDAELEEAYAKKPILHTSLDHYPKYFCNRCLLYCPLGSWKERFHDTGLSKFGEQEGAQ